jgi:lysozyme
MAKIEFHPKFLEQIKRHEGLALRSYMCPAGKLSIGYGHNLTDDPVWGLQRGDKISLRQAEELLQRDVRKAARELDTKIPWWRSLCEPRQAVILNMAFNMGVGGVLGFSRMLAALCHEDYTAASYEMIDSDWHEQVGVRSEELARQMRNGTWETRK